MKQLLLGSEQSLDRKVQEAALAWQLENRYTKERILELYLNTIYLGNGAYGLSAASQKYFGKPPDQLTVAEGALLAGIIRAPERLRPLRRARGDARAPQPRARRHARPGADRRGRPTTPPWPSRSTLAPEVPVVEERYVAGHFVEEVKQWILDDPRFGATAARAARPAVHRRAAHPHDDRPAGPGRGRGRDQRRSSPTRNGPAASLVAIEPQTGHVRVMVGGRDFFGPGEQAKFNLATGNGRHTGSAFKPIVLAAALAGRHPADARCSRRPSRIQLAVPERLGVGRRELRGRRAGRAGRPHRGDGASRTTRCSPS